MEQLRVVEGRWPQKKGVRLDQRPLAAEPFVVSNKSFTVEAWVRLIGLGTHRGNDGVPNGTLLSIGSGYWDGWRLTVSYPLRTLGFEIGRPKPSQSIGINSGAALSEGDWHHVAVTWNGHEMRIFVDGALAGSGPYDGDYAPPPHDRQFRVGYADNGVGSVEFDVDEVTIHSRALSDAEILKEVESCGPQAPGVQFNLAKACAERNDFEGARQYFRERSKSSLLGPRDRVNALFDLGDLCSRMSDPAGARDAYARIVGATDALPVERCLAQLGIAASYVQQQNPGAAKQEFAKAAGIVAAPPHLKQEASERAKEMGRLQRGLPARDPAATRTQPPMLPRDGVELFVSPKGADTNPGTKGKPFASLERARDEIRVRKTPESSKPITVFVRGGDYPVTQTFKLGAQDSGGAQSPVYYAAYESETPRFTGGVRVRHFTRVTDPGVLARLPEEARGKVWQADLKAQGINNYGMFAPTGAYSSRPTEKMLELFFDGKALDLARWPNSGFVMTGKVLGPEAVGETPPASAAFVYDGDRPARWKGESDPWVYGYWFHDWADSYEKIASIDTALRQIVLDPPLHRFGFASGRRYYALNLLSEIDRPGEWYLDRSHGLLYVWPPSDPNTATVEISMFAAPLVELGGVSNVTFQGFTWETGRDGGVRIQGGKHCLLAGCTVRNFAGDGVVVEGGTEHGLLDCDICGMGCGGVIVRGGDRKTLTPANHFVENCHIHHVSRINHTYTPAVLAEGVGVRVRHNLMHDIGSSALRIEGNDQLVELNEIRDVVRESDDQGGLDTFGNPTFRGNVYRYNFFHHIGSGRRECGQAGIRLDDAISGTLIYGNVFWRCADGNFGGVQIHGGKDNIVDNNLFVDCKQAVSFSPWGRERWDQFLDKGLAATALKEVDVTRPPYSTRYPELSALRENIDANHVWRNLALQCGQFTRRDQGANEFIDNRVTNINPGFADLAAGDFRMEPSKRGSGIFAPIPFDDIGLYRDSLRKQVPTKPANRKRGDT